MNFLTQTIADLIAVATLQHRQRPASENEARSFQARASRWERSSRAERERLEPEQEDDAPWQ